MTWLVLRVHLRFLPLKSLMSNFLRVGAVNVKHTTPPAPDDATVDTADVPTRAHSLE
jgi:hypothetical protein